MERRRIMEDLERKTLAPYAQNSADSLGRRYPEPEHGYRTCYARDRDRVVHSRAFRRLEYKTQVFVNSEGDHYRTRLTHTLEVACISRTIARALRLNEDLAEAIGLAHDIGHPPFGHSGEEVLKELMAEKGGFEHNLQGLRIVELLETHTPGRPGLNLSYEVRESFAKHFTSYDSPAGLPEQLKEEMRYGESMTLEGQVCMLADEIAYDTHDIDDGLRSGVIRESDLSQLELWRKAWKRAEAAGVDSSGRDGCEVTVRKLIGLLVSDLIEETERRLNSHRIKSVADVRGCSEPLVAFSPEIDARKRDLAKFLYDNFYMHWRVRRMFEKARRLLKKMFSAYEAAPLLLPPDYRRRAEESGKLQQVICDYIAGMTDRFAIEEYGKLFDPKVKV